MRLRSRYGFRFFTEKPEKVHIIEETHREKLKWEGRWNETAYYIGIHQTAMV